MLLHVLILITSFFITFLSMPSLIILAIKRSLFQTIKPVLKSHSKRQISNLGGVAIFISIRITQSLFIDIPNFPVNYVTGSLFILFLVGLNDDLKGVRPISRLLAQLIVSIIIVFPGGLYINSFEEILGIHNIEPLIAQILTMIFIIGLVNAFNLIDGVDGLAGTLGMLGSFTFGCLFHLSGNDGLAMLALALFGAIGGFLIYNISPAKIFMGDSGAYIIGFLFALFSVQLINQVHTAPIYFNEIYLSSAFGVVAAITIVPVFDTARVFFLRLYNKTHPFKGDNNHIHHRLLKMGLTPSQIALILGSFTLSLVIIALSFQSLAAIYQVIILFSITLLLNLISFWAAGYPKKSNSSLQL
jgi:UDP-N-acetylmuramyl pentapeptide phosphotransferase/UDP-N-acetylglucosamine-1-phosphate transferase